MGDDLGLDVSPPALTNRLPLLKAGLAPVYALAAVDGLGMVQMKDADAVEGRIGLADVTAVLGRDVAGTLTVGTSFSPSGSLSHSGSARTDRRLVNVPDFTINK